MFLLHIREYCYIFSVLLIVVNAKHHKHNHNHQQYDHERKNNNRLPYLSIDAFGYCHTNDGQLNGRCVRYESCPSALRAWHEHQIYPLSCYYTTYENFVCCPDDLTAYYAPSPILPTLSSHLPLQDPPQPSAQVPLAPLAPLAPLQTYPNPVQFPQRTNNEHLEERISEQECSDIYLSKRRRDHRSKRDHRATSDNKEPVQEEIVEKVTKSQTEVVAGVQTYEDEFPFMCALGWKSSQSRRTIVYNCGCVLVAKKYVLSAAHCASIGGDSPSVVRLGGIDLDERHAEVIKIKQITQHPEYNTELAYHDIAIMKLERSSRESPACLWAIEGLPQQQLTAIGYGQTKFAGPSSNSLLKVFLTVLTNQECSKFYKAEDKLLQGIGPGQICAGDPQGKMDTCQGDSGGPLLMNVAKGNVYVPYIVGLTSFGEGCATGTPSVYTRIYYYIDWIENIIWK